jgi:hypothetical protein
MKWITGDIPGINNALLYKLLNYRKLKVENPNSLKWQWNAAYNIARRQGGKNKDEIEELKRVILNGTNNYRALDLCCIGGRWADLQTRNQK